jgi:hypothetical protein
MYQQFALTIAISALLSAFSAPARPRLRRCSQARYRPAAFRRVLSRVQQGVR